MHRRFSFSKTAALWFGLLCGWAPPIIATVTASFTQLQPAYQTVGDLQSKHAWVFLCGLSSATFHHGTSTPSTWTLDHVGKASGIKFYVLRPRHSDARFNGKRYWPHSNPLETRATYRAIIARLKNKKIAGWIGFSNGGFFLGELVQLRSLGVPVILIGAGGNLRGTLRGNNVTVIIGTQDTWHWQSALRFYRQARDKKQSCRLLTHGQGHIVPAILLMEVLKHL